MAARRANSDADREGTGRPARSGRAARARIVVAGVLACAVFAGGNARADDAAYDRTVARLADRIEAIPRHRALREAIDARLATLGPDAGARLWDTLEACQLRPIRVPGLFYASHPQSGADLSVVSDWLGAPVPMIPTDEVGTREENAATIARAILDATSDGGRAALLSASKGSADVATALVTHPEIRPRIALWIDLVGAIDGTPLLDPDGPARVQSRSWLPARTADSFAATARAASLSSAAIRGIFVVHLAAFPRVADVSEQARPAFEWLRTRGPNDGYVLLADLLRRPGRVLVIRHTDHYLRSEAVPARVVAALHVAIDAVGGACATNVPVAAGEAPEASERAVEHPEDADRAERVGGKRAQDEPRR